MSQLLPSYSEKYYAVHVYYVCQYPVKPRSDKGILGFKSETRSRYVFHFITVLPSCFSVAFNPEIKYTIVQSKLSITEIELELSQLHPGLENHQVERDRSAYDRKSIKEKTRYSKHHTTRFESCSRVF